MRGLLPSLLLLACGSLSAPALAPAAATGMPAGFCGREEFWSRDPEESARRGEASATPAERTRRAEAWAIRQATPGAVDCDVEAWVIDSDPAGLNVRAAPSREAAVVATLPYEMITRIAASQGEWFLVCYTDVTLGEVTTNAVLAPFYAEEEKRRADPAAVGWVHGSLLGVGVLGGEQRAAVLRAEPRPDAAPVGSSGREVARPLGCRGGWWKIRVSAGEGWLSPEVSSAYPYLFTP